MQTDGRNDMKKLRVFFCNFAKAPKITVPLAAISFLHYISLKSSHRRISELRLLQVSQPASHTSTGLYEASRQPALRIKSQMLSRNRKQLQYVIQLHFLDCFWEIRLAVIVSHFMAINLKSLIMVLWNVTPCCLVVLHPKAGAFRSVYGAPYPRKATRIAVRT